MNHSGIDLLHFLPKGIKIWSEQIRVLCQAVLSLICCVCIKDKESGNHVPLVWTLNEPRCPVIIESLLDHFTLFRIQTSLQHMGFSDTTSDKTNQRSVTQLILDNGSHLAAWTSEKCCRCERHQCSALFCAPISPLIRTAKPLFKIRHCCHWQWREKKPKSFCWSGSTTEMTEIRL